MDAQEDCATPPAQPFWLWILAACINFVLMMLMSAPVLIDEPRCERCFRYLANTYYYVLVGNQFYRDIGYMSGAMRTAPTAWAGYTCYCLVVVNSPTMKSLALLFAVSFGLFEQANYVGHHVVVVDTEPKRAEMLAHVHFKLAVGYVSADMKKYIKLHPTTPLRYFDELLRLGVVRRFRGTREDLVTRIKLPCELVFQTPKSRGGGDPYTVAVSTQEQLELLVRGICLYGDVQGEIRPHEDWHWFPELSSHGGTVRAGVQTASLADVHCSEDLQVLRLPFPVVLEYPVARVSKGAVFLVVTQALWLLAVIPVVMTHALPAMLIYIWVLLLGVVAAAFAAFLLACVPWALQRVQAPPPPALVSGEMEILHSTDQEHLRKQLDTGSISRCKPSSSTEWFVPFGISISGIFLIFNILVFSVLATHWYAGGGYMQSLQATLGGRSMRAYIHYHVRALTTNWDSFSRPLSFLWALT